MKKDLGKLPAIFPMPVLIVAAYDENGTVQAMNAAWGMMAGMDKVALSISERHATVKAIRQTKAFTVSLADRDHLKEADYFGIASGNTLPDKFDRSGCHAQKSASVNAPVIDEFPVCMECELLEIVETENLHAVVGRVVNVRADEKVLGEDGKVDPARIGAVLFDQFRNGYYAAGEKAGDAWSDGRALLPKE